MADLSKSRVDSKPKTTTSLPYGVTQEAWDTTSKMRDYLAKLRTLEQAHIEDKHRFGGYCDCGTMVQNHEVQAILMADIRRALLPPPDIAKVLETREKALRILNEVNTDVTQKMVNDMLATDLQGQDEVGGGDHE